MIKVSPRQLRAHAIWRVFLISQNCVGRGANRSCGEASVALKREEEALKRQMDEGDVDPLQLRTNAALAEDRIAPLPRVRKMHLEDQHPWAVEMTRDLSCRGWWCRKRFMVFPKRRCAHDKDCAVANRLFPKDPRPFSSRRPSTVF